MMFLEKFKKYRIIFLVALLFIFVGTFFYFWNRVDNTDEEKEVADVIERVARHIVLPEGVLPTVATVKDPDQLKEQPFFLNAKVGDKVLIYPGARRAILYRPSEDKIIEVAPLNIGEQIIPRE